MVSKVIHSMNSLFKQKVRSGKAQWVTGTGLGNTESFFGKSGQLFTLILKGMMAGSLKIEGKNHRE